MTTIIAGNLQQQEQAQRALSDLAEAGFAADQLTTFFVNPPGQHDLYPIGGDEDESPGTEDVPGGAASGAAVGGAIGVAVGVAAAPFLGPAAAVAGAGVGAYTGSLYGALGKADDDDNREKPGTREELSRSPPSRKSGVLVAASAPTAAQQEIAIGILRTHGATDIERAEGTLVGGQWTDFNPLTPLNLIAN